MAEHQADEHQAERDGRGRYRPTITAAQRRAQAVQLRTAGVSFRDIAAQLGYANPSSAYRAVQRALDEIPAQSVAELRALNADRLDGLAEQASAARAA